MSLERVIEESRDTYSEALERSSAGWHSGKHDPFPWLEYFWGTLLRAYDEFRDRAGRVLEGRGSKTALVEVAVARRSAPFAIYLRDDGALRVEGRGRGARASCFRGGHP